MLALFHSSMMCQPEFRTSRERSQRNLTFLGGGKLKKLALERKAGETLQR